MSSKTSQAESLNNSAIDFYLPSSHRDKLRNVSVQSFPGLFVPPFSSFGSGGTASFALWIIQEKILDHYRHHFPLEFKPIQDFIFYWVMNWMSIIFEIEPSSCFYWITSTCLPDWIKANACLIITQLHFVFHQLLIKTPPTMHPPMHHPCTDPCAALLVLQPQPHFNPTQLVGISYTGYWY